ncbi:uncharacterized protein Hap1MRO34_022409 [Clarias gariepinus]
MSTDVCFPECEEFTFLDVLDEELLLNPLPKYHPLLTHSTHTSLQVCDDAAASPRPDVLHVQVFDPSKNIRVPFILKGSDTADTLIKKYLQERPELGKNLHLALNGRRVSRQKSLSELGVKSGAVFITFQRCIGG